VTVRNKLLVLNIHEFTIVFLFILRTLQMQPHVIHSVSKSFSPFLKKGYF